MSSREQILGSIRSILKVNGASNSTDMAERRLRREQAHAQLQRKYNRKGKLTADGRLDLFLSRVQHYDANTRICQQHEVAYAVSQLLAERGKRRMVVPSKFPADYLSSDVDVLYEPQLTVDDLDHSDGVLSGCTVAIAWTGTMILVNGEKDGLRASSLVPDYLLCIIREEQIVETVPEAMDIIAPYKHLPITFISGPSASVDIEMTRVRGMHGPRTLDVIIAQKILG